MMDDRCEFRTSNQSSPNENQASSSKLRIKLREILLKPPAFGVSLANLHLLFLQRRITVQLIILWGQSKGQNVNSGNFNAAGTGFRDSNINTVHSSGNDNGLSAIENGIYCVVQNGQIFVNGRYKRNMQSQDYLSLYQYKEGVARWSASLSDNIQLSFPWDPRNPEHKKFPWNPAAFPGKRRRRAVIPFPRLPRFCYE